MQVPRHALSDIAIRAANPPESGARMLWDATLPRFGVRITSSGVKTFIILVGSGKRQAIGRFPAISLAQARHKAKLIFAERTLGRYQPPTMHWRAARDLYLEHAKPRLRPSTYNEYVRILATYFTYESTLADITPDKIAHALDRIKAHSQREHALAVLKIFFRWALSRGYLQADPTTRFKKHPSPPRARVLIDTELAAVWKVADEMAGHFGTIVKLLILSGQRRGEIAALQSSWIQGETVIFPASITKNRREHYLPLSTLVLQLLSSPTTHGLYFPARGKTHQPFHGWSKAKAALDRRLGGTVAPWTLHDLRRTFATNLAALAVPPHITERLLNHATGTISGVAAIYNRHAYMDEMRAAIALWEQRLSSLLAQHGLANAPAA